MTKCKDNQKRYGISGLDNPRSSRKSAYERVTGIKPSNKPRKSYWSGLENSNNTTRREAAEREWRHAIEANKKAAKSFERYKASNQPRKEYWAGLANSNYMTRQEATERELRHAIEANKEAARHSGKGLGYGVSSYTHTSVQLDDYANQNNPNSKAYHAKELNHKNQLRQNRKNPK